MLIMTIDLLLDALELGFHCVRTHWIRGFMAFLLARRTRTAMLMVSMCPESGFLGRTGRPGPLAERHCALAAWLRYPRLKRGAAAGTTDHGMRQERRDIKGFQQ
jgi:hypothetical protein